MPRHLPVSRTAHPNADRINQLIRHLMRKPASRTRTAEWQRLLILWAEATRNDIGRAA